MKFSIDTLTIAIALAHVLVTFSYAQPFTSNMSDVVEHHMYHQSHTYRPDQVSQQSTTDEMMTESRANQQQNRTVMLNFLNGLKTNIPSRHHSENHSKRSVLFQLQEHVATQSYQQSMKQDLKMKKKQVVRKRRNFKKSHFPFSVLF